MAKYCPNCGEELIDEAKFCKNCGAKIEDYTVSSAQGHVPSPSENGHTALFVIGFILSFLNFWAGLIVGIYLLTRKGSKAKYRGIYLIIIAFVIRFLKLNFIR